MINKIIKYALCLIFLSSIVCGQNHYNVINYNVDSGLSSNTIFHIWQDDEGFLWIMTKNATNRFDGFEFVKWNDQYLDSIQSNNYIFKDSYYDGLSNIFLDSREGFFKFDLISRNFKKLNFSSEQGLRQIFSANKKSTYIFTYKDLFKYNLNDDTLYNPIQTTTLKQIENNKIQQITCHNDQLWIATKTDGIFILDDKQLKKINFPAIDNNRINSFNIIDNKIFVCIRNKGLMVYSLKDKSIVNLLQEKYPNDIQPITTKYFIENESTIYFAAYYRDIYAFNKKTNKVEMVFSLPAEITSLFIDENNILWAGTNGTGIYKIVKRKEPFETICKDKNQITFNSARNIYFDSSERLWIGGSKGLCVNKNYPDENGWKEIKQFNNSVIYSMIELPNKEGEFLIASLSKGLYKYNYFSNQLDEIPSDRLNLPKDARFLKLYKLFNSSSNQLYITSNNGLIITDYDLSEFKLVQLLDKKGVPIKYGKMPAIDEDNNGLIWLGTSGKGLFCYDPTADCISKKNLFVNDEKVTAINHLLVDNNIIWMGTDIGLVKNNITNQNIQKFEFSDLSLGNIIYSILSDDNYLWLGSSKGLIRFDTNTENYLRFYNQINLSSKEFNSLACLKDKNGILFMGGISGVLVFDPKKFSVSSYEPKPLFSNFKRFVDKTENVEIDYIPNNLDLDYVDKYFSFQLGTTDFEHPENIRFRYSFSDIKEKWIELPKGEKTISFYKLEPGKYTLTISVTNSDGIWSPQKATLNIAIAPPYWETWWFRILAILFIVLLIYLFIRSKVKKIEKEKELHAEFSQKLISSQETEREKIAGNLHDSIGQDLLIVKNLLKVNKDNKPDSDEEIQKMLSKTVRSISQISHDLHPLELDELGLSTAIESMVDRIKKASNIMFELKTGDLDNLISKENKINLFRIVQEALNNVVKHSCADKVAIKSNIDNGLLKLIITDNGIGCNNGNHKDNGRPHMGISGMQERTKLLKGKLSIVPNDNNGTKVILTLPIKSK